MQISDFFPSKAFNETLDIFPFPMKIAFNLKNLPYVLSRTPDPAVGLVPIWGEDELGPQRMGPDLADGFPSFSVGSGQLA